jgi:hypothetical protein
LNIAKDVEVPFWVIKQLMKLVKVTYCIMMLFMMLRLVSHQLVFLELFWLVWRERVHKCVECREEFEDRAD